MTAKLGVLFGDPVQHRDVLCEDFAVVEHQRGHIALGVDGAKILAGRSPLGADIDGFTVDGSEGFDKLPGVSDEQDRRYYALTIKPQVFVNLVSDHIIFHRMYPVAEDRTVVECDWLYSPEVVASGKDVSRSVELFHRVNLQDFDACERCQPAMSSRAYAGGGVLVPSEHHIGEFHEWVTDKIGGTAAA